MALPLAPFGPRTGLRGMVAAADQLAASAGIGLLAGGGSAADAAVGTGAVMAVVGPHLCGLGGDVLAMVSPPGSPPEALLSVGRAGAGSDPARLRAEGMRTMPLRGDIRSVQVPGAVDGWLALHERHGRLPLEDVLAPAIELASDGFAASIMLALASHLVHALPGAGELCPEGPLAVGQAVRLPGIARTLRAIARHGRDGFYQGEFGRGLLELGSGHFAPADLATSAAAWCAPLRAGAWGHDLWTVPPPSQGYLTLAGAVVAEAAGLGTEPDDPQWPHLLVETWRAVGHDRPAMLFDGADGTALLDPARLAAAAARVDALATAPPDVARGHGAAAPDVAHLGDGDTTHLCALDADGLGVSLTQSNALDFGSHLVEPATGVFLHNRGVGFSLVPGHPAEVAPGRRPPHTLSPMLVTAGDGALTHLVGAMGGDAQPQIIVQLLARLLHAGQDAATAITAPRLTLDAPSAGPFRLWWGEDLTVLVESDAPPAWQAGLTGHGHRVRPIGAFDPVAVGCAQIIAVEREGSGARLLVGASDPRSPSGGRGGSVTRAAGGSVTRAAGGSVTRAAGGSVTRAAGGSVTRAAGGSVTRAAGGSVTRAAGDPLRIASLAKQVPLVESLRLADGRLVRTGVGVEMNPYCRRAVAQGVTLARETGGTCTAVTLGPPGAEDVLREAVAWGADAGLHACDAAFAGSDTLATARTLAAVLRAAGPFDLILLGRNSIDGETGQVGPQLAELLDLPFATGVRRLEDRGARWHLELEHDDGMQEVEIELPAVLSVAERLCDPCKVEPEGRAAVLPALLARVSAVDLGPGPWGEAGSPTVVGATRAMEHGRALLVLDGPLDAQVEAAVRELSRRGALSAHPAPAAPRDGEAPDPPTTERPTTERPTTERPTTERPTERVIAVLAEPGRPAVSEELLGAAVRLGRDVGAAVHAVCPGEVPSGPLAAAGADVVVVLEGSGGAVDLVAEDVADALAAYVRDTEPWAVLAPSTAFGREVAGRVAAATGSGLVGDAMALSVGDGGLVAAKPAFAGALVADITCRSATQMVTVRPGVLPPPDHRPREAGVLTRPTGTRGRVRVLSERRDDDVETLARANAVIGVGTGVPTDEYELLAPLAALLGAELAATRKVTDRGWAPRSRQVGVTGRSIAPRLYVAVGLSGKFNHMVGVRAAGTILAVNADREAPVFDHCDVGIVGDWHEVVPLLHQALRRAAPRLDATPVS